jgi:diacylglycerol kinase family enzyme
VEVIQTSPHGQAANRELLEKHAQSFTKSTLLCIAAGDGTTNQAIETLLTSKKIPSIARRVPILPLWGGNANDLAHMLNGPAYRARLQDILKHGNIAAIHPLYCEIMRPGKPQKNRIAACYASFGVTAFAAHKLNDPAHRKSRLQTIPGGRIVQEFITLLGAFMEAPALSFKDSNNTKIVYELSFYNGSRMAKIERLPAKLTEDMFYINTFENKKLLSIIPRLIELTRKSAPQRLMRNYSSFTVKENSWAQFDGESLKIPSNTKVRIQLFERPFYALSTSLKSDKKK